MEMIKWFILVFVFLVIGAYSLTFIQNNNIDSQIYELEKFESCKILYLESILTNESTNDSIVSSECASNALYTAKSENENYLKDKGKIIYYMFASIISSMALIILSIKHPFHS
jgi:hypothetical protein